MTLAEFLLARIAEDDAAAVESFGWGEWVKLQGEAKRRVVDAYADAKHHYDEEHDINGSAKYGDGAVWGFLDKLEVWEQALKILALPYNDHPDFNPDWRL